MNITETDTHKCVRSTDYNYVFDKRSGAFARWGTTKEQDPLWSPYGVELCDIELSSAAPDDIMLSKDDMTIVTEGGCRGLGCQQFCYKQSTATKTIHMSLAMVKRILDKMPRQLCQIAYGICDIDSHPQLWEILDETRRRSFIPNLTTSGTGMTDEIASKLANVCGAVAVSVNPKNRQIAYDAVKRLSQDHSMDQINFHIVLAEDTVEFVKSVVDDIKKDNRLSKLNALVMLSFKDKGKTNCFSPITLASYKEVIEYCKQESIVFGFDSCSASTYMKAIEGRPDYAKLCECVEPCESGLFSIYINVFGAVFACSFCENIGMWKDGLNVLDYDNMEDLWHDPKVQEWRRVLLDNDRNCPFYNIGVA